MRGEGGGRLAHFSQHLEVCRGTGRPVRQCKEGRKYMKNNSKKVRGLLAGAVLVVVSAGLGVAQEVISSRKVLKSVAAQYPSVLKRRGIGGTVKLRVLVNANGSVKDVQVLGGNPILSDCAVKAVKQWVFVASEKEESIEISVGFDPNSSSD
jgi:TonB family protein